MATTTAARICDTWRGRLLAGLMVVVCGSCGSSKPCVPSGADAGTGGGGGGAIDGGSGGAGGGTSVTQRLLILHTNDIHSHLMGGSPEADYTPATVNDDATIGGFARLATAITQARTQAATTPAEPVLLLDAGDFMMGTLFEFLATSVAPELRLMQSVGYDATTIGNHELDWTPAALALILQAAKAAGVTIPIVASNMHFSATNAADDSLNALYGTSADSMIRPKLIKTVGRLKVGIFGLLGADAVRVTPQAAPLTFDAIADAARVMVNELRTVDKVDLVIALSHSGISSAGTGEDADLAAAAPGIDVIVSGHTHDSLNQPKKIGNTLIVTAGAYTQFLGELELTVTTAATAGGAATVTMNNYTLLPIDDKIAGDVPAQSTVTSYITAINGALAPKNLAYSQVIGSTSTDLKLTGPAESPLGDLVTDAYKTIASAAQSADPPVIAFEGNGQIRSDLLKGITGKIWLSDLFRVTPLGIGPTDMIPGAPLVTFYLNAKDIKNGLELGAGDGVDPQYFLQLSGLKVQYDMTKPSFARVASVQLVNAANTVTATLDPTNTTTCYKVVSTNFVAGLLGVVKVLTGSLLSVDAKDKDCVTLVDPTTRFVDADPTTPSVDELKQWQAVLKYISSFPDSNSDSIPDVPALYFTTQGRITR